MKTRVIFRAMLLMLLVTVFFTCESIAGTGVKVMTYNVDEGTDFSAIVGVLTNGGDFAAAIQQTITEVKNSRPDLRAQLIANEIATAQPDLVGLQEAAVWTFPNGQETENIDLLQLILGYPGNLGSQYQAVVIQPEFQIDLTEQFGVAFTDRDVILVRSDLVSAITGQDQRRYFAVVPLTSLPGTTGITRGWGYVDMAMNEPSSASSPRIWRMAPTPFPRFSPGCNCYRR
jgi:hypothetical protein